MREISLGYSFSPEESEVGQRVTEFLIGLRRIRKHCGTSVPCLSEPCGSRQRLQPGLDVGNLLLGQGAF
jgi:hypothetical protein